MDTDNKTTEENKITGGEKSALHDAGVDLSPSDEKRSEEFIDIDNAPAIGEDEDLKKIGLNFVQKENKEDLSLLKEKMDKNITINNDVVKASSVNSPKLGTDTNISDLEKEFNQTVGQASTPIKNESLNEKISSLNLMLTKIKEKLGFKKTEVKEELENLKKVKEDIAKDIENIKDLEESKGKIEDQLSKVENIKGEISDIEKEVAEELKS
ncbi:MAG: hypothetical protein QG654_202 [Patescibacteria group bacterium]|nr:hypothetical protein [Patescibacteria group bacterium]